MLEDTAKRTESKTVYILDAPDILGRKQRLYRCHSAPQYYKDSNNLYPIDTTLLTRSGGWFHQGSGYQCELPSRADGVFNFTNRNGHEFITKIIGALPVTPVPTNDSWGNIGKSLTYHNALGRNVSIIMEANRKGLRKIIRWDSPPAVIGDQKIVFEVQTSIGEVEVSGRIINTTIDENNAERIPSGNIRLISRGSSYISNPLCWDSNLNNRKRLPVNVYFYQGGGKLYFVKVIPGEIFRNAVYPVFADDPVNYAPPTNGNGCIESSSYAAWDSNHDATTGGLILTEIEVGSLESNTGTGAYKMIRGYCPIDTSGITDTDTVTSAILNLGVVTKLNDQDNDGDDWFNVVESRQASMTTLAAGDFDLCGSAIDNPTELSTRQDYSTIPAAGSFAQFTLNGSGLPLVSKTSYTPLAVREGHDCIDSPVVGAGAFTGVRVEFASDNHATLDPFLDVTASAVSAVTPLVNDFNMNRRIRPYAISYH